MDDDIERFRFSPPDTNVVVSFGQPERPHGDELTFFEVALTGSGLDARVAVESLSGDYGVRPREPGGQLGEVTWFEDKRLSGFLRELGNAPTAWDGQRGWRSLADELRVEASCDNHGCVTLVVTAAPRPWQPPWSASATFQYALGDLVGLADAMEAWFTPPS